MCQFYPLLTVSWVTRKQQTVALSSTESEYVALSSAVAEACWLKSFLTSMNIMDNNECITLFEDNQEAIKTAKNVQNHKRMKHIDIKHHFIREKIAEGSIKIKYVASEDQVADIFTKPLRYPAHRLTLLERGPRYSGLRLYNALPRRVRDEVSDVKFAKLLKDILINGAFYTVNEFLNDHTD